MRTNLPKVSKTLRLERTENMAGSGFPDVWALDRGTVTAIELKAVDFLPLRLNTSLIPSGDGLSVAQRNWHRDWNKHLGTSFIILAVGKGPALLQWAVQGWHCDELNHWPREAWDRLALPIEPRLPKFWLGLAKALAQR